MLASGSERIHLRQRVPSGTFEQLGGASVGRLLVLEREGPFIRSSDIILVYADGCGV